MRIFNNYFAAYWYNPDSYYIVLTVSQERLAALALGQQLQHWASVPANALLEYTDNSGACYGVPGECRPTGRFQDSARRLPARERIDTN